MRHDPRSPIWGGATLGLLIGIIYGIVSGSVWDSLFAGIGIGAIFGVVAGMLGWVSDRLRARGEPNRVYAVSEADLAHYERELADAGVGGEERYLRAKTYAETGVKPAIIGEKVLEIDKGSEAAKERD